MHFRCPTCSQLMQAPDTLAGTKAHCPACGQRVQVPAPPAAVPTNKTLLAEFVTAGTPATAEVAAAPAPPPDPRFFAPTPPARKPKAAPAAARAPLDGGDYMTRCYSCGKMLRVSEAWRWPHSYGGGFHWLVDTCWGCVRVQLWLILFFIGLMWVGGIAFAASVIYTKLRG